MDDFDWLYACPDTFRDKLKSMIDCPPGAPGSEGIYDYVMLDEFKDPDYDFYAENIGQLELKARRKYAQAWGRYAEALTARRILEAGMPLREWNWSPGSKEGEGGHGRGEIDLITQKGNRMIFIEVKARCGKYQDPLEAIDEKKRMRICRGADIYLKMQRETYEWQFDVALLTGNYLDYKFEYIEDAFFPPLKGTVKFR